jgi:hypothetical protein
MYSLLEVVSAEATDHPNANLQPHLILIDTGTRIHAAWAIRTTSASTARWVLVGADHSSSDMPLSLLNGRVHKQNLPHRHSDVSENIPAHFSCQTLLTQCSLLPVEQRHYSELLGKMIHIRIAAMMILSLPPSFLSPAFSIWRPTRSTRACISR